MGALFTMDGLLIASREQGDCMMDREVIQDLAIGLAAGCIATAVTDLAQPPLARATPEREKEREPDTPEGGSAMSAAQKTVDLAGMDCGKRDLRYLKTAIHYGLGASWGVLYVFLRRNSGMSALGAGVTNGTALSLVIDEMLNPALNITPQARAYPMSSHLRGLVAHLIFGAAVAAASETLHLAAKGSREWSPGRQPE